MALLGFRRSTLVDAAVNLVPFGVVVAFLALFLAVDPWRPGLRSVLVSVGVLAVPLVVLVLVTAVAARGIQQSDTGERPGGGT